MLNGEEKNLRIGLPVRVSVRSDSPKEVPEKILNSSPYLKDMLQSSVVAICSGGQQTTAWRLVRRLGFGAQRVDFGPNPMKGIQPNIVNKSATLFLKTQ